MANPVIFVPEHGAPGVSEPCHNTAWFDMDSGNCYECDETNHVYIQTPTNHFAAMNNPATPSSNGVMTKAQAAASVLYTTQINLGATPIDSGNFIVTGLSGLTAGNPVRAREAGGPGDFDEMEMDQITAAGTVIDTATVQIWWGANPGPVSGLHTFAFKVNN